mgnify:CR=1 FL=1
MHRMKIGFGPDFGSDFVSNLIGYPVTEYPANFEYPVQPYKVDNMQINDIWM